MTPGRTFAGAAFAMLLAPGVVLAQGAAGWDGTWSGTNERGGAVQIVIAGGQVQSYTFQGRSQPVGSTSVSGNQISFTVGTAGAANTMTAAGRGKANWTFSHPQIGNSSAVLTKK